MCFSCCSVKTTNVFRKSPPEQSPVVSPNREFASNGLLRPGIFPLASFVDLTGLSASVDFLAFPICPVPAVSIDAIDIVKRSIVLNGESIPFSKELGRGSFATVVLVVWNGVALAMKLTVPSLRADVRDSNAFLSESHQAEVGCIRALSGMDSVSMYTPKLIAERLFLDALSGPISILLMPYYPLGITGFWDAVDVDRISLTQTIWDSMCGIHNCGFRHRDVKPENLRVDEDGQPVWIDWALSGNCEISTVSGTPNFLSPALVWRMLNPPIVPSPRSMEEDRLSDQWALILTFHALWTRKPKPARVSHSHTLREFRGRAGEKAEYFLTLVDEIQYKMEHPFRGLAPEDPSKIVALCQSFREAIVACVASRDALKPRSEQVTSARP